MDESYANSPRDISRAYST